MEENNTISNNFWDTGFHVAVIRGGLLRYMVNCDDLGVNEYKVLLVLLGASRNWSIRFTPRFRSKCVGACFPGCGSKSGYEKFSRSFRKLVKAGIIVGVVGGGAKDYRIKYEFD